MPGLAFLLCAITSLLSSVLLWRAASGPTRRMLMWSAMFFFGMTLNNLLLFVDVITGPNVNWMTPANAVAAVSIVGLIYALVWESN